MICWLGGRAGLSFLDHHVFLHYTLLPTQVQVANWRPQDTFQVANRKWRHTSAPWRHAWCWATPSEGSVVILKCHRPSRLTSGMYWNSVSSRVLGVPNLATQQARLWYTILSSFIEFQHFLAKRLFYPFIFYFTVLCLRMSMFLLMIWKINFICIYYSI